MENEVTIEIVDGCLRLSGKTTKKGFKEQIEKLKKMGVDKLSGETSAQDEPCVADLVESKDGEDFISIIELQGLIKHRIAGLPEDVLQFEQLKVIHEILCIPQQDWEADKKDNERKEKQEDTLFEEGMKKFYNVKFVDVENDGEILEGKK